MKSFTFTFVRAASPGLFSRETEIAIIIREFGKFVSSGTKSLTTDELQELFVKFLTHEGIVTREQLQTAQKAQLSCAEIYSIDSKELTDTEHHAAILKMHRFTTELKELADHNRLQKNSSIRRESSEDSRYSYKKSG